MTSCPEDFRIKCYGSKCQNCQLECKLKSDGTKLIEEIRHDKYLQHGGKIDRELVLMQQLDRSTESIEPDISDPARLIRLDAVRQMVFFYIEHPAEFDKFVMEFFLDKNQSDLARERNMTRANVSKRIVTERGDKLKREIANLKQKNAAFSKMTTTELKVYQLCGEDGIFNVSNIAKQTGVSRVTVYATLHKLREKYGFNFTLDKARKKKKLRLFKE
jgi:DNA-binding MarR family transcriptional regulator